MLVAARGRLRAPVNVSSIYSDRRASVQFSAHEGDSALPGANDRLVSTGAMTEQEIGPIYTALDGPTSRRARGMLVRSISLINVYTYHSTFVPIAWCTAALPKRS